MLFDHLVGAGEDQWRDREALRHPSAPGLSLAGVRLIIPDHALGLPVLRALSWCTCCRHYPGAAAGCIPRSSHPTVSAFPGRVAGSACTSTFSRLARRSLALRPAHSRGHQFVTRYSKASDISSPPCLLRLLPAGANRRVGLAPTGKRRLVTAPALSGPSWPDRQPTDVDQGAAIRHASAHVATADGGRPEPACYAVDRFPPAAQSQAYAIAGYRR